MAVIVIAPPAEQGADVNATSEGGQTPLHLAAFHGAARETLQILFSRPELRAAGKNAQGGGVIQ